jgi:cytochrome P450
MLATATRLVPPIHPIPESELGKLAVIRAMRSNALTMWSSRAYERPAMVGSFLGRMQVLLNDPSAIQRVLVTNAANYTRPVIAARILRPLIGNGLLLSEGPAWRHQRRTIAPTMTPRMLPVLMQHVAAAAGDTVTRLDGMAGRPVALLPEMQRTALEIAGRSMFSLEMGQHGGAIRTLLMQFATELARPSVLELALPSLPTPRDAQRRQFRAAWMGLINRIVSSRAKLPQAGGPRDLFDMLLAARDPANGAAFTRVQLCDQIATMILAGHETTALALFWSLNLLAQSPEWQDRVAAEAAEADLSPEHASEAVAQLPATRAVVSEALRLYPPAFLLTREAIAPDLAGRVMIPRGATIAIAPWLLHRHARLWDDAHAFDPARFMPGAPAPARFSYLPFGAGPRVCVAAQFALNEAIVVLATLARAFAIRSDEAAQVMPTALVTTQPDRSPSFFLQVRA